LHPILFQAAVSTTQNCPKQNHAQVKIVRNKSNTKNVLTFVAYLGVG